MVKVLSLLEKSSEESVRLALSKLNIDPEKFKFLTHPQEDYLLLSKKHPIYVVADGVTLIRYLLDNKEGAYPNPSPAGDVARIFCESFVKTAEERYDSITNKSIKEIFGAANDEISRYNKEQGKTKNNIDYWENDFYAATVAFAIIKRKVVYWGSLCDSYVMHFSKDMELLFSSPHCHSLAEVERKKIPEEIETDKKLRTKFLYEFRRNAINEKGQRSGYGVATGEPEALHYLSTGCFNLKKGESFAVFTDGFVEYMKLPEFTKILAEDSADIRKKITLFTENKAKENPGIYGDERSLILVTD